MVMNAIIVGFVLMMTKFLAWWGSTSLERPIFCVAILGALLGHPTEGLILGAQLELVFLGNVSLGGVMPSDYTLGAVFGSAFAMLLGKDLTTAVTLALPLSVLGTVLYSGIKVVVTSLVPSFEGYIKNKNIKGFKRLWVIQLLAFNLLFFGLGFICIMAGTDAISMFVDAIPDWVQKSMTVASTMLPALGMALLMKSLWNRENCPYYFLGFAMGAFLLYNNVTGATLTDGAVSLAGGSTKILSLVTISFIGAAIAALVIFGDLEKNKTTNTTPATDGNIDESEDFFND